jgi:hypothetical protein
MVDLAIRQLGYASPADNNPYNEWYWGYPCGWAWCDAFVSWLGAQTGQSDIVGKAAACPIHVNWFRQRGQWHSGSELPREGDLVFFDWAGTPQGEADHVGLVVGNGSDGLVWTVEGNTSGPSGYGVNGVVAQHSYPRGWSQILGYGRPDYANAPTPPKPVPGIIQWTPNFHANQKWIISDAWMKDYVLITDAAKGRAIDIEGGSTKPNARIVAFPPKDPATANQLWYMIHHASGAVSFISALLGNEDIDLLALDITGSSKTPGAQAVSWPYGADKRNQQYFLIPTGDADGSVYIVSATSLLPLDVYGG